MPCHMRCYMSTSPLRLNFRSKSMEDVESKHRRSVLAKYTPALEDHKFLPLAMDFDVFLQDSMELAILAIGTKCGIQVLVMRVESRNICGTCTRCRYIYTAKIAAVVGDKRRRKRVGPRIKEQPILTSLAVLRWHLDVTDGRSMKEMIYSIDPQTP